MRMRNKKNCRKQKKNESTNNQQLTASSSFLFTILGGRGSIAKLHSMAFPRCVVQARLDLLIYTLCSFYECLQ